MKKLILIALLIVGTSIKAQVGIGINAPTASLHVKNGVTASTSILKVEGSDTSNKLEVKEDGKVIIQAPVTNNSVNKIYGINTDNSFCLLDKSTMTPTGLERLNEGNGNGWRLIGRNPLNYGNIGKEAVDFSESLTPSTTKGATTAYSFIGPGYENSIYSTVGATDDTFNTILGGRGNTIKNSPMDNDFGVAIIGGNDNLVHTATGGRTFATGNTNTIHPNAFGNIIGDNNVFGAASGGDAFGNVIGVSNTITVGASADIIGYYNTAKNPYRATIIGNGNESRTPWEVIIGDYAELAPSVITPGMNAPDSYYTTTNDVMFRVGIGYRLTDLSITRKDGFRVYKNGKVEIRQLPVTDNTITKLYGRATDGSFALVDKQQIIGDSGVQDLAPAASVNLAYLNTTYASKPLFFRVYNKYTSKIYTKVEPNKWVSENCVDVL